MNNIIRTMNDVHVYFFGPQHGIIPAAVITKQNKRFRSFKSKENIHTNEDGPDSTVSNNEFSSVTLYNWH